ncbi:inorganic triphosphatase [Paraglaciecola sp. L3A3]|uniref:CYTH domain-containing protein n=1 Tax=Paraglaciecola sp. L3A3 TaxID=2686358 RepID=UPI00131E7411|nr:CYTH domain-containing protein [Paraglaciecola sp. L3A3]
MEYEIELKLLAADNAGDIIEQKLLPQLNCVVTKQVVELSNYYFDTDERTLRKNDIGLRIRGKGKQLEQTLKTAGSSVGGLYQRPEYNVQLADRDEHTSVVPDLSLFPQNAWPAGLSVEKVQQKLATLFTTNFVRKIYLLDVSDTCQIEMVWDLGSVSANGQSVPICEIELELKKGNAGEIFVLAQKLLQVMYLSIGTDSKAARGYRLADSLTAAPPNLNPLDKIIDSKLDFIKSVENSLAYLQYFSALMSKEYSADNADNITRGLQNLEISFQQFSRLSANNEVHKLHQKVMHLHQDWLLLLVRLKNINDKSQYEVAIDKLLFQPDVTQLQLEIVQFLFELNRSVNS